MSYRLDKERSRERMRQLVELWGQWDPIGVADFTNDPGSEYRTYAGETMRFLERGDDAGLREYLRWAVSDHMGLEWDAEDPRFEAFSATLHAWFRERWLGTHV